MSGVRVLSILVHLANNKYTKCRVVIGAMEKNKGGRTMRTRDWGHLFIKVGQGRSLIK